MKGEYDYLFILPMLGDKHPDDYPRFRGCTIENNEIHIDTRVGGENRNCGYGEDELYQHPNYLRDFDFEEGSSYATYVFSVPDEFKSDFELVKLGKINEISEKYKARIYSVFPEYKNILDETF